MMFTKQEKEFLIRLLDQMTFKRDAVEIIKMVNEIIEKLSEEK